MAEEMTAMNSTTGMEAEGSTRRSVRDGGFRATPLKPLIDGRGASEGKSKNARSYGKNAASRHEGAQGLSRTIFQPPEAEAV